MTIKSNPMPTPVGPIARLSIGRVSDIKGRRETDIEVTNVAVRSADRAVFLNVIKARENQLAAPGKLPRKQAIAAAEVASYALAAKEAIATDCPPELIASHLETAAARAIDLLVRLQVKN
ncbi:MAG: hypothetical protein ACN4E6_01450 [Qipengyuania pacifica]